MRDLMRRLQKVATACGMGEAGKGATYAVNGITPIPHPCLTFPPQPPSAEAKYTIFLKLVGFEGDDTFRGCNTQ